MTTEVPIQIAGQTGGHRSKQFNSEQTQNMYLDTSGERAAISDFPGLKPFATKSGRDRGWHKMAGVLYKLIDATLWRVASNGLYANLGTIPGADRGIFADDGLRLFVVTNSKLYRWESAGGVTEITNLPVTNPKSIAYLNRKFIVTGDLALFATSDPASGGTWNDLNTAEAEVRPDRLQRVYTFNQLAYMLGNETTEVWYDTGAGNPPLARQDTSLVNIGIAGKYAVTATDSYLYWLGDDRKVYQCVGAKARPVRTLAIAHIIEGLTTVSDCIASHITVEGQTFVMFRFPSDKKTLMFSETFNYWVEMAGGTAIPSQEAWYGNAMMRCYEKNLVSQDGDVLELDNDTYTDNGQTRLRIRTLPSFTGKLIGKPSNKITVQGVKINMQLGVGLATGQGSAPVLMCQMSPDAGESWQDVKFVDIGVMGDYVGPVWFYDFCNGYEVQVRIMCSDPVFLSMFDGIALVDDGGY